MKKNSNITPQLFRAICDSFIGINTGYDFGPFQDPNFIFPLWNIAIYNNSIKNGPKIQSLGSKYHNYLMPLGGSHGLGYYSPSLEYVASLSRTDAAIYFCGARNYGLYSYAIHTLHSLGLLHTCDHPVAEGWLNDSICITSEFLMLYRSRLQDNNNNKSNMEDTFWNDFNKILSKGSIKQLPISSIYILLVCYAIEIKAANILNDENNNDTKSMLDLNNLYCIAQNLKYRANNDFDTLFNSLKKIRESNLLTDEEKEVLNSYVNKNNKLNNAIRKPITWETSEISYIKPSSPSLEIIDQQKVLYDFNLNEANTEVKSIFIKNKNKLQYAQQNIFLIKDLNLFYFASNFYSIDHSIITNDIAEYILNIYPTPDEIQRINYYLDKNINVEELSLIDKLLVNCLEIQNMKELLKAYIITLNFNNSVNSYLVTLSMVEELSRSLCNNNSIKIFFNIVEQIIVNKFEVDFNGFYLENLLDLLDYSLTDISTVLDKSLNAYDYIVQNNKDSSDFLNIIQNCYLFETFDLVRFATSANQYINEFKTVENYVVILANEKSITPTIYKLYIDFRNYRIILQELINKIASSVDAYREMCKIFCVKDPTNTNPFEILFKLYSKIMYIKYKNSKKQYNHNMVEDNFVYK